MAGYDLEPSSTVEAAAFELIGRKLYPSDAEKLLAHEMIEDFVSRPLPRAFFLEPDRAGHDYEMFAHKLLPRTWDLLESSQLARPAFRRGSHFSATAPMGLALMNLLADCCAGSVFARATDRGDAYASLAGLLLEDNPSPDMRSERPTNKLFSGIEHAEDSVALVPIALDIVDLSSLTLGQVVEFRRQEQKASGDALRILRHRFADSISDQAQRFLAVNSTREAQEIKRQFRDEMRGDYEALKEALKLETEQVLGSKEIITAGLVALAQVGEGLYTLPDELSKLTLAASAIAIGGLLSSRSKFARTRRKILEEHPTAYLYESQGGLRL